MILNFWGKIYDIIFSNFIDDLKNCKIILLKILMFL